MPIDRFRPEMRQRFDHGQPLWRASSVPFTVLFSALTLMLFSLQRPPVHAVVVEVPVTSGLGSAFAPWRDDLPRHTVQLTQGGDIWWDDDLINQTMLLQRLQQLVMLREGLVFRPDGNAAYDQVAKTMNLIAASGVAADRLCLAGLADHRQFGRAGQPQLLLSLTIPQQDDQAGLVQADAPPNCDPAGSGTSHSH